MAALRRGRLRVFPRGRCAPPRRSPQTVVPSNGGGDADWCCRWRFFMIFWKRCVSPRSGAKVALGESNPCMCRGKAKIFTVQTLRPLDYADCGGMLRIQNTRNASWSLPRAILQVSPRRSQILSGAFGTRSRLRFLRSSQMDALRVASFWRESRRDH